MTPNSDTLSGSAAPLALRAALLDCVDDPFHEELHRSIRYIPDGLLVIEKGHILALGPYETLQATYQRIPVHHYPNCIITPGFIDTHIHYPQMGVVAAYGEQLLSWLTEYVFPEEKRFHSKPYALRVAELFLDELLRHGTTTALVFTTIFPESVNAFFEAAQQRNLRMIAGKVMMDRHAPDGLRDTASSAYEDTEALIHRWHHQGRALYAVTPRFAVTSSPEQLAVAGQLLQEFPDVYLHTHLSENVDEVAAVKSLFPHCSDYLQVYEQAGLVTDRSVFAHGVQLSTSEFQRLAAANAAIAFCPSSNMFLGSGLFPLHRAVELPSLKLGLGTDIGAGTSFSLLNTAGDAYKVAQLQGKTLSPFQAFFLATLGGARALNLGHLLGNFAVGKEADVVVLNPRATPLMAFRNAEWPTTLEALGDCLFSLMIVGDERAVEATYIMGQPTGPRP
ncbi:MAG: guanine deaminase [Cyanobacteria bacterium P01_A01_bin.135]